jgi:hypothetical protein
MQVAVRFAMREPWRITISLPVGAMLRSSSDPHWGLIFGEVIPIFGTM